MAEMIATLSDACEREFGFMAARLFRVFKNDEVQGKTALRCQGCPHLWKHFISASILNLSIFRQEMEENMLRSLFHSVFFDAGMPDHRLGVIGHL